MRTSVRAHNMSSIDRRIASQQAARHAQRSGTIMARRLYTNRPVPQLRARRASAKELNFLDTSLSGTGDTATPSIILLNGMAQGTTASTRIGRKIDIKSIQLHLQVATGSTGAFNTVKWALVIDHQANGAAPSWQDIFDNSTALGANTAHAMRNISNAQRFTIIHSEYFDLTGNTGGSGLTDDSCRSYAVYRRVNITTQYNAGTAGTVADIQTGALYFVVCGTQTGTAAPLTAGYARIRYRD